MSENTNYIDIEKLTEYFKTEEEKKMKNLISEISEDGFLKKKPKRRRNRNKKKLENEKNDDINDNSFINITIEKRNINTILH